MIFLPLKMFVVMLKMTSILIFGLLIQLSVSTASPSSSSSSSTGFSALSTYQRVPKLKHYAAAASSSNHHHQQQQQQLRKSASSMPYPSSDVQSSSPYSRNLNYAGKHQDNFDNTNLNGNIYSVVDLPTISDEYLDTYHETLQPAMPENSLNSKHQQMSTCQTVCACKWKGGKQTVECIDRLLSQIPDNIDASTQVLDMSGNSLHTLLNEQFLRANLLNLQKLYLRNCKIEHIEAQTFKGLTNLVELDLSQNRLEAVPSMALSFISSLRDLTLASNRIQKIDPNAFANTPALHKLDLSHCDIQLIAAQAFEGLEGLTLLRLNGNKLSELVPKTIATLSRLHGIELHDNPWMCDCRLREAKLWLMKQNIPYPVAPVCSGGPERIMDQTFADLSIDDFACKPEMLPSNHYVEAIMGENASILCKAKSIPAPVVNWYWNGRLLSNNTAFSSHQRLHILENGGFEKNSRLVLTNAQEIDSSEFFCVAENRAGSSESNFTLHVRMRAAGMASLGSGQIVGLSAALVFLIIFVLLFVIFLLMRLKREPYTATKTPNHMEVITSINQHNMIINKTQPNGMNGSTTTTTSAGADAKFLCDGMDGAGDKDSLSLQSANPLQKPPRLIGGTSYINSSYDYDKNGSILETAPCFISPTSSSGNNPDLIIDTKRFESEEFADLKIPKILTKNFATELAALSVSGEYNRAGGCDSLYPSGLWEDITSAQCTSSADDLFLRRYSEKGTNLQANHQMYDTHESSSSTDNFSKTFPRTHFIHSLQSNDGSCNMNTESTASTTTTNLSNSGSGIVTGGYPNDYGLPVVPGAELQLQHHLQMNPLQKQLLTGGTLGRGAGIGAVGSPLSQRALLASNSSSSNSNSSPTTTTTSSSSNHAYASRTLPRQKASTSYDTNSSRSSPLHNNNLITHSNSSTINAKTIRVWQKGGVPVLPPVTAIKRALISTANRNSPDEGYQEGCGTDV